MKPQEDILDEALTDEGSELLVKASLEKRLVNYLLDSVLCGIIWFTCIVALAAVEVYENLIGGLIVLLIFLGYPLYYFITENVFAGKSIAKYITGTRAVDLKGNPASTGEIAIRSMCRMVPFERFSFLFNFERGWHDVWSNTMVIDEKQSVLPVAEERDQEKEPERQSRYLK